MKKEKDYGKEHLRKFLIPGIKDFTSGIKDNLAKVYGHKKAEEIRAAMDKSLDENGKILYSIKNSDYNSAMIITLGYDYEIIRKACNWIHRNQHCFGDTIFEIGCDCGIITTYLASLFPEKKIVAIDRNPESIDIAAKNMEKFNLTNVELLCGDIASIIPAKYDTVFSMRTLRENVDRLEDEDTTQDFFDISAFYSDIIKDYTRLLSSFVKTGGTLITVEKSINYPMLHAEISNFNAEGIIADPKSFTELPCIEINVKQKLEALVYRKTCEKTTDVFDLFMQCYSRYINIHLAQYDGWNAKIMREYTAGKIIDGVVSENINTGERQKYEISISKFDETCVVTYNTTGDKAFIYYNDISDKDEILASLERGIEEARQAGGFRVRRIKPE